MKKHALTILIVLGIYLLGGVAPVLGLSGSEFKAGKIITDSNFFNDHALTAEQIQQFLETKMPSCDTNGLKSYGGTTRANYGTSHGNPPPFVCLKDYRQAVPYKAPEDSLCNGISSSGTSKKTAAQIIDIIAKSCGVSQKVLIVLLQKEQSLVTDDWPWDIQYRSATGYGCPDTAPCDSEYYGFFNQVYNAARIYKYYAKYPNSFNHIAGERNFVRYHPNSSCGGTNVFIENQATAGLYNYTPYQPNGSALNNLYGTGNGCSAYGNRNFWRIYNDWFGSTLSNPLPIITLIGDWDGDGETTVGIRRGNQYFLDNNNDGEADVIFGIGRNSDVAIVGDWDGDGKDEIGLRRGNYYYLDTDFDNSSNIDFGIGRTTDEVIVGDWDGDGKDEIGLRRGNYYYFDDDHDGKTDFHFGIGRVSDALLVGDWDNDNIETIGLRRGNHYFLDNNHSDNVSEIDFGIGRNSDVAIVGDWDGDGSDNIGLKRGNHYYLDTDFDNSSNIDFGIGRTTDEVIVGDWDGDGKDEIGLRRYTRYYFDTDNDGASEIFFTMSYY
jgi:hypothetical protein